MTLDEAIRHCEDVVEEKEAICNVIENEGETWTDSGKTHYGICKKCAEEHRQLAEWLRELKQLREQWQDLKETIIEGRDGDGTGTQQEICKFLANYMDVLEKNVSGSEKSTEPYVSETNVGNMAESEE